MARVLNKLSARAVQSATKPGRLSDGGGLFLRVKHTGAKSWSFKWKTQGKAIELAIGPFPAVSLVDARQQATRWRELIAAGGDPRIDKTKTNEPSFQDAYRAYLEIMESQWSNAKHRQQWHSTLDAYCGSIHDRRVSTINLADVLSVLNPIWSQKPETASRLRGRIERVLSFAQTKGWRSEGNPAIWRGNLENVLPKPRKLTRGHHQAMPYADLPSFMVRLRNSEAMAARALELLILTACRSGEILHAQWPEFDLDSAVWVIPANRMKSRKEHRVPLSGAAMEVLKPLHEARVSNFIFPGQKAGKPLSGMAMEMLLRRMKVENVTVHGFRSSFRDWAGDETGFPRETVEEALAHSVGNATERAYRRSDALERRRQLMEAWADYCGNQQTDKVVRLHG